MDFMQSLMMIFAIILLGIVCERKKILTASHIDGIQAFLLRIALPCYLFTSTLHHDLKTLIHLPYIYSYLLAFLGVFAYAMLVLPKMDTSNRCASILATGYCNTTMYSLPVVTLLLGDPSASIMAALIQIICIQSIFLTLLSFEKHKEKSMTQKLFAGLATPLIAMPTLGLLCNALGYSPYPVIPKTIEGLGQGVSSLTLFTFGLTLGSVSLNREFFDKPLMLMTVGKTIIHPFIAFCVGRYIFDLSPYWLSSLVISTCAPTAFVIYLIAKQFDTDHEMVKKVIALTSVLSLISLGLIGFVIR
jgi:predicted permease